jgi:hypothetical protein
MDDSLTTDGMEGMAPRTARHARLSWAFGHRPRLSLGWLPLAALSPRVGGRSGSYKAPLGLPVGFCANPRLGTLADQHRLDYTASGNGWRG